GGEVWGGGVARRLGGGGGGGVGGGGGPGGGRGRAPPPGAVLVEAAGSADGLLVVGTGSRRRWLSALRPSVARYCLAHAVCPVLAVPPNPLEAELAAVQSHSWTLPPMTGERKL
ncbi:universal stress protein, partial [Streptomyces anulatus]|uniref:universal stress protein n=1 Tax=Streptomyces anulatus TaxID=1892 RepID=UPI0036C49934